VELKFYNPFAETRITRHNLPHWQQPGVTYFITYRLADAIPNSLLTRWKKEREIWLSFHPTPWTADVEDEYHRRFSSEIERWLDAGHGSCVLRDREVRRVVEEGLQYFEGERHHHFSWVIMPNHVHVLTTLHADCELKNMLFTWKRRSAGEVNRVRGTTGQVWQHEYFDRIIRDGEHFENVVRYIRRNPEKAKLQTGEFTLFESEDVKGIR
jgi:putative transposase